MHMCVRVFAEGGMLGGGLELGGSSQWQCVWLVNSGQGRPPQARQRSQEGGDGIGVCEGDAGGGGLGWGIRE